MQAEELPIIDRRDLQRSMMLANVGDTISKVYSRRTKLSVYAVLEATNQIMNDHGFRCEIEIIPRGTLMLVNCKKDLL